MNNICKNDEKKLLKHDEVEAKHDVEKEDGELEEYYME